MAPGNFKFILDKFSIFQVQRLGSTDVHPVPNIVHGPIVVAIEGVVACNSFLNDPITTLSWLELQRYYSSFIYFWDILFILCSSDCLSKNMEYCLLSQAGFFSLKILLMKLQLACSGLVLFQFSFRLWRSQSCFSRVSLISMLLFSLRLMSLYLFIMSFQAYLCWAQSTILCSRSLSLIRFWLQISLQQLYTFSFCSYFLLPPPRFWNSVFWYSMFLMSSSKSFCFWACFSADLSYLCRSRVAITLFLISSALSFFSISDLSPMGMLQILPNQSFLGLLGLSMIILFCSSSSLLLRNLLNFSFSSLSFISWDFWMMYQQYFLSSSFQSLFILFFCISCISSWFLNLSLFSCDIIFYILLARSNSLAL